MARELAPEAGNAAEEKKKLKDEKNQIKKEQKQQRKDAKLRAKEISKQEEAIESEESNGLLTAGATILIIAIWLAVICVVVKLNVGGFGSNVLTPILKDVPVLNKILPNTTASTESTEENYDGYTSLQQAVEQIRKLELDLERAQTESNSKNEDLVNLRAEVQRLQEFEDKQVEFQRIKTEFYNEVIYAENGPGAEAYVKYFESMDASTAEYLYKQVIAQQQEDKEIRDYAAAYSNMKPKNAAQIFEAMTDNLDLVARILNVMDSKSRGNILAEMDAEVAARLTKIMDPEF